MKGFSLVLFEVISVAYNNRFVVPQRVGVKVCRVISIVGWFVEPTINRNFHGKVSLRIPNNYVPSKTKNT